MYVNLICYDYAPPLSSKIYNLFTKTYISLFQGVLALNGITLPKKTDAEADQNILLCSCNDNSVRLYALPSFEEKGRFFTRQEVRTIQKGPGGLIFTGDGAGRTTVWKTNV